MSYDNKCGRFEIHMNDEGKKNPDYGHGVSLAMPNGWNDYVGQTKCYLSVEELHDLKHLIDRCIQVAEKP